MGANYFEVYVLNLTQIEKNIKMNKNYLFQKILLLIVSVKFANYVKLRYN